MNPELQKFLDGEIGRDALPPELRAEADRLVAAFRSLDNDDARAPAWLETRIMASLPETPCAPWHQRVLSALLQPRTIRVRPVTIGVAGALAALVLMTLGRPGQPGTDVETTAAADDSPVVYVQFVFAAGPGSRSVSIAGDFNEWRPDAISMRDPDGDGVWTALVALKPGVHKYMFVVNGEQWVTDPHAERHVDDGFGMRNAVVSVAARS